MIEFITIRGFLSIAAIENLRLNRMNVLIGANGSGKSNFVKTFGLLNAVNRGIHRLEDFTVRNGGANNLLYYGSKITKSIYIEVFITSVPLTCPFTAELTIRSDDNLFRSRNSIDYSDDATTYKVAEKLLGVRVFHFHDTGPDSKMKQTASLNDNGALREDGSNLAAYLYYLKAKHPQNYEMICKTIRLVAPFFIDFDLKPNLLNLEKIILRWNHKGSDNYFDASSLSDGTLRFIALATVFLQPKEFLPPLIIVDEPELGLHPYAITLLASMAKSASVHTQVILSTQSPTLLDHFDPQNVLVAERKNGATVINRLEENDLKQWLEDYSLGQLWDKNEFGGRPQPEEAR